MKFDAENQFFIQSLLIPLTIIAISESRNKVHFDYAERSNNKELNSNLLRVNDSK